MEKDKKESIKISVNTFNWGPCVTRFKIQDDFRKVLLDEARKSEEDFSDRLAGQIAKERGYSEKNAVDNAFDTFKCLALNPNEILTIETKENTSFVKTIDETVSSESSKRKSHLEKFNHKFSNQYSKIEDLEKEPAYKRKGRDIEGSSEQLPSRLSLDNDSNDDLQIRSNNSFLHDNVD